MLETLLAGHEARTHKRLSALKKEWWVAMTELYRLHRVLCETDPGEDREAARAAWEAQLEITRECSRREASLLCCSRREHYSIIRRHSLD